MVKNCYQKSLNELIKIYDTTIIDGLSHTQAKKRLTQQGLNKTPEAIKSSLLSIFINQYKNYLSYILFCSAGIIFFFWSTF